MEIVLLFQKDAISFHKYANWQKRKKTLILFSNVLMLWNILNDFLSESSSRCVSNPEDICCGDGMEKCAALICGIGLVIIGLTGCILKKCCKKSISVFIQEIWNLGFSKDLLHAKTGSWRRGNRFEEMKLEMANWLPFYVCYSWH